MCIVLGPGLETNLLIKRMLAKVPRAIISSLPRLDPYELNSRGVSLANSEITNINFSVN